MNKTTQSKISQVRAPQLWTVVRHALNERRQARAQYRVLERELAAYNTHDSVNDLLGAIEGQDGVEVDMIRSILTNNLAQRRTHQLAS